MLDQTQDTTSLSGQRQERLEKLVKIKQLGIDPYPARSQKDHPNQDIHNRFTELENKVVTLTGRITSRRDHGKLVFMDLFDQSGKIQLYIKDDTLQENLKEGALGWDNLVLFDIGDFAEAKGTVTKTQRGEISLLVTHLRILTKSLRPIPRELVDKEQRYRRRYLDLQITEGIRERFQRKAKFWQANRDFMRKNGFIEVETPVLEHVTGGADARPFVTHHNDLEQDFFLRISTELYQKRLVSAGFEKIFTLGPNFRNEGLSDEHLQEYYQIEWYWAYADYKMNMELVKSSMRYIAKEVYGTTKFTTRGHSFDLNDEWKEIDYVAVIKDRFDIDIFTDSDKKMKAELDKAGIDLSSGVLNRNRMIDNLWKLIRKTLSGPAFLINEPMFMSPLAKTKPEDSRLTERFHVIIAGSELGNGYSEKNDPQEQLGSFLDQQKLRDDGDDEAQMLDIDYVEMLEYGMPPTSGYAHSERLFWFLEDVTAREGTLFPLLRRETEETTKEIYPELFKHQSKTTNESEPCIDLNTIPTTDRVIIEKDVVERFPGIKTGYIVLENVDVAKSNAILTKLKERVSSEVKLRYSSAADIRKSKNIKGFREIYKEFGVDPDSHLNSAESLLRRVLSGKSLYNINTVVDTYNVTSIEFEVPMAAYDLDQIKGTVTLRFAKEGDSILKILETEPTKISQGELVYSDDAGVTCMDFNFRDSDRTKITEATRNIIVFVDGHESITISEITDILSMVGARLETITGGKVVEKAIIL